MTSTKYTYRQKYTEEYETLRSAYNKAVHAYSDLIDGKITSYTLGNRSVTRSQADMNALTAFIESSRTRMCELEAILNGRAVRDTTRCVFVEPANSYWFRG